MTGYPVQSDGIQFIRMHIVRFLSELVICQLKYGYVYDAYCQTSIYCILQMAVSLVNGRPSAYNFSYSPLLQDWTKATNVRLRLIQTKTLYGHLMALRVEQDPTVTRRVSDISSLITRSTHLQEPHLPPTYPYFRPVRPCPAPRRISTLYIYY